MSYDPPEQWRSAYQIVTAWNSNHCEAKIWHRVAHYALIIALVVALHAVSKFVPDWVQIIVAIAWLGWLLTFFVFPTKEPTPTWRQRGVTTIASKQALAIQLGFEASSPTPENANILDKLLILRSALPSQPTARWFDAWRHFYTYRRNSTNAARWVTVSWIAFGSVGYLLVEAWYGSDSPAFMRNSDWSSFATSASLMLVISAAGVAAFGVGWATNSISNTLAAGAGFGKPTAEQQHCADVLSVPLDAIGKEYAHQKGIAL